MIWKIKKSRDNQYMDLSLIKLYHDNSKHSTNIVSKVSPISQGETIQRLNHSGLESIDIPTLNELKALDCDLSDILKTRHTSWDFNKSVTAEEMYLFLQYSFGVTRINTLQTGAGTVKHQYCKTYPSGGALYPIDIYILANRIIGIKNKCIYKFDPIVNKLITIKDNVQEDRMNDMTAATKLKFKDYSNAAFFVFLVNNFERNGKKYGLLSYRLSLLEAGHISQNIMLVATALKMNSVPIGGYFEDELNRFIGVDSVNETVVYFFSVG